MAYIDTPANPPPPPSSLLPALLKYVLFSYYVRLRTDLIRRVGAEVRRRQQLLLEVELGETEKVRVTLYQYALISCHCCHPRQLHALTFTYSYYLFLAGRVRYTSALRNQKNTMSIVRVKSLGIYVTVTFL